MKARHVIALAAALGATIFAAFPTVFAAPSAPPWFTWTTEVNNTDYMPTTGCEQDETKCRPFNSYNQPSVNERGLVVIRARSRGGQDDTGGHGGEGEVGATASAADDENGGHDGGGGSDGEHGNQPVHGIYTRDMGTAGGPGHIVRILDRKTEVPQPNNLGTTFVETPSFPRIDMLWDTIATRGNHQPVWTYGSEADETRAGTTGIHTNPFGDLITGASKLGAVPEFELFAVPGVNTDPPTMFDVFDVFPGAPAVTGGDTIVFKGNFTVDGVGRTGVFYRVLENVDINNGPSGGNNPVVLIANNLETVIPGTDPPVIFGSTSPPSAANGRVVFAGFDNEQNPTLGGIYLAELSETPELEELVSIGGRVPGESVKASFNNLGEGGAFDGRYVGFWGAWGAETRTVRVYCPTEGNKDRIAYCNQKLVCEDTREIIGDPDSVCHDTTDPNWPICYQDKQVPVHQGIFVHDTAPRGGTRTVAKTGARFDELLFWNFSGKTPCVGGDHSEKGAEDDGEPARWRSSAFVAVSGLNIAFKAVASGGEQGACGSCHSGGGKGKAPPSPSHGRLIGIYLNRQPGQRIVTVLDTRTDGQLLDPEAPVGSTVVEVGLEREGLRGDWLAVSAKMAVEGGAEEDGMAGVYLTEVLK